MAVMSVSEYCNSKDPLSDEAIEALLHHNEEDPLVDYKRDFDPESDKHWIGITIDAMSFANTHGGYLVFGVEDKTWAHLGLSPEAVSALTDVVKVRDKIGKYIKPNITMLRTKHKSHEARDVVVCHIPESKGQTHIAIREASCSDPHGKTKVMLRPGTIYIRQSGGNRPVDDPYTLQTVLDRHMEHFKTGILDRIARVVTAPAEAKIMIAHATEPDGEGVPKYTIIDSSDPSVPVGQILALSAPKTAEEQLAYWMALSKSEAHPSPSSAVLWRFYANRHVLMASPEQKAELAKWSLISEMPPFFWMRDLESESVKTMLVEALRTARTIQARHLTVRVSAFLGRGFMKKQLTSTDLRSSYKGNLPSADRPRDSFKPYLPEEPRRCHKTQDEDIHRKKLETLLDSLICNLQTSPEDVLTRHKAWAIDCYLYARDDLYRTSPKKCG